MLYYLPEVDLGLSCALAGDRAGDQKEPNKNRRSSGFTRGSGAGDGPRDGRPLGPYAGGAGRASAVAGALLPSEGLRGSTAEGLQVLTQFTRVKGFTW